MLKSLAVSSVVALTITATIASAAYIRYRVNPLPGNGNFEVIEGPNAGPQRIWCEAAKYAVGPLRSRGNTRMYILHPSGRAKTQKNSYGVGFTIAPTQDILDQASKPGDGGNYSVSVSRVGYNLSVSHARGFCGQNILY